MRPPLPFYILFTMQDVTPNPPNPIPRIVEEWQRPLLHRSLEFEKYGLMGMDAMHVACAENAKADFFVTCDDNLIKKLERIDNIGIHCCPVNFYV